MAPRLPELRGASAAGTTYLGAPGRSTGWPRNFTRLRRWWHRGPAARPAILRVVAGLFVLALFFESFRLLGGVLMDNASSLVGYVLSLLFVAVGLPRLGRWNLPNAAFLAFVVATVLAELLRPAFGLASAPAGISFRYYLQYLQTLVLYFIMADLFYDPRAVRAVAKVFIACAIGMAVLSSVGFGLLLSETEVGRVGIKSLNLNAQSFLYALAIVAIVMRLLDRLPRLRTVDAALLFGAGVMLVALVRTGSRTGAAVLLAGLALGSAMNIRRRRLSAYFLFLPAVLLAVAVAFTSATVLRQRITATVVEGETGLRAELALSATQMFKESPLLGRGAAYVFELPSRVGIGKEKISAHSAYLEVLVASGIIGGLPWIIGVLLTLHGAWRFRATPWGGTITVLLVMTMVAGMVGNLLTNKYFWILMAMASRVDVTVLGPAPLPASRQARRLVRPGWVRRSDFGTPRPGASTVTGRGPGTL